MISVFSISEKSIGVLPEYASLATENPFANLLRGAGVDFTYLIELDPFDESVSRELSGAPVSTIPLSTMPRFTRSGGINTVYLSDKGFFTEPDDDPANTSYLPLVNNAFQFNVSIMSGREFRGGLPSFGAIRIKAGDGSLDGLSDMFWSGRRATIYAGGKGFSRSEFEPVFNGVVQSIEFDEDEIVVNISDKSHVLETSFNQILYAGTGGLEGGEDIKGDVKPLCYGEVKNVPLKLVDQANNIYQVHDGSIEEVTTVYDRGVALNDDGDVADITAASVSSGNYKTQLSGGYIKLGGNPDGRVTADVKGCNAGGYVDHVGAIASRLVSSKMGDQNFGSNDIAQGDLNALDSTIEGSVGIFINKRTQLNSVIDDMTVPLNLFWLFTRTGRLSIGLIDSPSNDVLSIQKDSVIDDTFDAIEVIPPAWRIKAGYGKNFQVQEPDDIAAAATDDHKSFATEEFRSVIVEDRNTRLKSIDGSEIEFESIFTSESAANDYLSRLVRIYQSPRKIYRLKVMDVLFRIYVGDVVRLYYDRYGLDGGKNFLVTSIGEDAEEGLTELEIWG